MSLHTNKIGFTNSLAATAVAPAGTIVKSLHIEPQRVNGAVCFVGTSALLQDGSIGLIRNLAVPPGSNGTLDDFIERGNGVHKFDAGEYYVWGTSGDGVNVAYQTL